MVDNIILYGGTFNPIHNGHLYPVLETAGYLNASRIIYIPCHIPPHKDVPNVSAVHRMNMVKIAVESLINETQTSIEFTVSDFEITQSSYSYTRKTVEYFKQQYPNHRLYFLIGADSLLTLHTWYQWQEILEFCHIAVMNRPNFSFELIDEQIKPYIDDHIHLIDTELFDVSSTQLRNSISSEIDEPFLLKPIQDYIHKHNLYA
jgi:nicotinate-nucleotide adenylyltransferase